MLKDFALKPVALDNLAEMIRLIFKIGHLKLAMVRGKKKNQELREQIMRSALNLFANFGFKKTAVDEIARGAKVAKGTIYNYFRSKDELIRASYRQELEKLLSRIQEKVRASQGLAEKLTNLFLEKLKGISESPVLLQVWNKRAEELEGGLKQELEGFARQEIGLLAEILKTDKECLALSGAELGEYGELIQNAFLGIEKNYLQGYQNRVKEKIEKLTEVILAGLKRSKEKMKRE